MQLDILVLDTLFSYITANRTLAAVVTDGADKETACPKRSTPQRFFDRGDTTKDFASRQAFDRASNLCGTVGGNRLDEEMDVVVIGSDLQEGYFIAVRNLKTNVSQHRVDRFGDNGSPIFGGANQMVQQDRNVMSFVQIPTAMVVRIVVGF
jgi:hypothetical protein